MQLFSASLVLISLLVSLRADGVNAAGKTQQGGKSGKSGKRGKSSSEEEMNYSYFTLGAAGGGCIGLEDGNTRKGDLLVLRTCVSDDDAIQWTMDDENRFHSRTNYDMCMQAGEKNSIAKADTELRTVACSDSELQKFDLSEFVSESGLFGHIKPLTTSEFCLVHKGPSADIGDAIILKKCAILSDGRAEGWKASFPGDDGFYFTLAAPKGGCIGLKNGSAHRGSFLFLRNCELGDDSLLWTLDEEQMFHSKVDSTMCIQAGRAGTVAVSGTTMRVVPCGVSNLQKFDLTTSLSEAGIFGSIKPAGSPELCMVHRNGPSAVIGEEPILLKDCASLTGYRTEGWYAEFSADNGL